MVAPPCPLFFFFFLKRQSEENKMDLVGPYWDEAILMDLTRPRNQTGVINVGGAACSEVVPFLLQENFISHSSECGVVLSCHHLGAARGPSATKRTKGLVVRVLC